MACLKIQLRINKANTYLTYERYFCNVCGAKAPEVQVVTVLD